MRTSFAIEAFEGVRNGFAIIRERSKRGQHASSPLDTTHPDLNAGQVRRGVKDVSDQTAHFRKVEVAPNLHHKGTDSIRKVGRETGLGGQITRENEENIFFKGSARGIGWTHL